MRLPKTMRVETLELKQFRNIHHTSLVFSPKFNIFVGGNGQGKTNIIEAIVYLSSGRSFRIQSDLPVIKHNEAFSSIEGLIVDRDNNTHLKIVLSESGKYLQVNQKPIKRLTDFIGNCNVVLFCPDDINFYADSPRRRRRDIDFELGKLSKNYIASLTKVQSILQERNALLKLKSYDEAYFDILTQSLVVNSVPVMEMRSKFINSITPIINDIYNKLMGTHDVVSLDYRSTVPINESIHENYTSKLHDSLMRDKDFKITHHGIHRDDYVFMINDNPVMNVSSQGQKRMLIIAFKLAIVSLITQKGQDYPILCLDDLFSELDEQRRKLILEIIPESVQVFITTTDLSFIDTNQEMKIYEINQGYSREVLK